MPGFPFLRLPKLVQSIVVHQVKVADLVRLLSCSKKAKNVVKFANVTIRELGISLNDSKSTSLLIRNVLDTFKKVETVTFLNGHLWNYHKANTSLWAHRMEGRKMSVKNMKLIFEELNITSGLKIYTAAVDGYQHSEGFRQEKITIWNAEWVHFDAILNSRSSEILLCDLMEPSTAQFITFLKLWMAKEKMEKLVRIRWLLKKKNHKERNVRAIANAIPHEPLADDFNGRKICVRRVDGKVATIQFINALIWFELRSE